MSRKLAAISGHQLIRLLLLDGWEHRGRRTHGVGLSKLGPDGHKHYTLVPDHTDPLAPGTLAAILGPDQSGLGRRRE